MRFTCEKCNAKYNIADEKIRGKIIKVRCKRCNTLLVIRDESHGGGGGFAEDDQEDSFEPVWYCGLDGNEQGPLTLFDVEVGIRDGSITSDHFVWRDGMDDWLPIEQVAELRDLLSLPPPLKEAQERRKKAKQRREEERQKEKERREKAKAERARKEKERREKERRDKERRDKERREKERREKERRDKERREKERREKERREKERRDKERRVKELREKELREKELREKERREKELREKERVVANVFEEEREDAGEPEPMPGPPVDDFDDDLVIEEVAEGLMQESIDDEYELLQTDPMAVVAKREEMGEISRVIAVQAGVASHKRRLGLGILVVGTFVLTIGLLVVLAFSQGWFTNKISTNMHDSSHSDKPKVEKATPSSGNVSDLDAKRIRDSIWVIEPKKENAYTSSKNAGNSSHAHSQYKSKKEREDLLAFYKDQDLEKDEVMPRMPRGAKSAAMELLKFPSTNSQVTPGMNSAAGSKVEVVPHAPGVVAGPERLTDVQIRMVIRRHARQVKKCFERQLKRDPSVKGKLLITARVRPDGKIKKVAVGPENFHGTYLEECLIREIRHWRFPSFKGEAYDLTFPYALSARESY